MDPLTIISRGIVAGGLTGARPALTLFLLQLYARFFFEPSFPDGFGWIIHEYAIIAIGVASLVEHFVRTDPDFEEMAEIPNQIAGVLVSIMLSVLIIAVGGQESDVPTSTESANALLPVTLNAGLPDGIFGLQGLTLLLSVGASLGLGWVRRRVISTLADVTIAERWWRWLETGGVIGAVTAIALVPVLAIVLAALIVLAGGGVGLSIWLVQKRRDASARVACACGYMVRKEALLCPECGAELEPASKLGQSKRSADQDSNTGGSE